MKHLHFPKRNSVKYENWCISFLKVFVFFHCVCSFASCLTQNAQFILNGLIENSNHCVPWWGLLSRESGIGELTIIATITSVSLPYTSSVDCKYSTNVVKCCLESNNIIWCERVIAPDVKAIKLRMLFIVSLGQICIHDSVCSVHRTTKIFGNMEGL